MSARRAALVAFAAVLTACGGGDTETETQSTAGTAEAAHNTLTPEEQAASDVTPGLVRISVGLESIDDIIADIQQAFAAAK